MLEAVFDIESDELLDKMTKIHCINVVERGTGQRLAFNGGVYEDGRPCQRDGSIEDGLRYLEELDLVGHNIIRFDIPAIQKLYPQWKPKGRIVDTETMASVIYTDLKERDVKAVARGNLPHEFQQKGLLGRQGLKSWGYRLGERKGDFEGPWDAFTAMMDQYGRQDPVVTEKLYQKLLSKNYSPECLELEHRVAQIIFKQHERGFAFDFAAAEKLTHELSRRHAEIASQLSQQVQPWYAPDAVKGTAIHKVKKTRRMFVADPAGPVTRTRKLDDGTKVTERGHYQHFEEGCQFTKVKLEVFNPGSRHHIADRLSALHGWTPTQFTDNGEPKIDDEVLSALPFPIAKTLTEYLLIEKRLGYVATGRKALMKFAVKTGIYGRVTGDVHRIHGSVRTNGAVTGRMTHVDPNLNAPRVNPGKDGKPLLGYEGGYGFEIRSLFIATPGLVLVGCDAEGLELRMLAHYMAPYDEGAYVQTVVHGKKEDETDVHNVNKRAAGMNGRTNAKTFIYALIYGAGDYKIGTIIYDDFTDEQKARFNAKYQGKKARAAAFKRLGKARRERIMENLPALGKLVTAVKKAIKTKGYLRGLDGRLLHIRAEHSALNTLLQSGGAVVMKKALVMLDDEITATNLSRTGEIHFVANVHDEFQMETTEENAHALGKLAADCIRRAGEHFKLRCPLAGSYGVGKDWAETH